MSISTSICIPIFISIVVPRVWRKKTQVRKCKGKLTYRTKGWRSKAIPCEFRLKDVAKLRAFYEILETIQIQIPSLTTLDNDTPFEGWTTFHKKPLFLGFWFPLLEFVRYFLRHTHISPLLLLSSGWRYLLCITFLGKELDLTIGMPEFTKAYNLKQNPLDP